MDRWMDRYIDTESEEQGLSSDFYAKLKRRRERERERVKYPQKSSGQK